MAKENLLPSYRLTLIGYTRLRQIGDERCHHLDIHVALDNTSEIGLMQWIAGGIPGRPNVRLLEYLESLPLRMGEYPPGDAHIRLSNGGRDFSYQRGFSPLKAIELSESTHNLSDSVREPYFSKEVPIAGILKVNGVTKCSVRVGDVLSIH